MLEKEQINRYRRHIIMPEISNSGQEKLLEASVLVCGESSADIMPLIMYLSAVGICSIYCQINDTAESDSLFSDAMDLNTDLKIEQIKNHRDTDYRIILGSCDFIKESLNINNKFVPTIISSPSHWKMLIQVFNNNQELSDFIKLLPKNKNKACTTHYTSTISGAICTIETVKLCLNIGKACKDLLLIDLFNMKFNTFEKSKTQEALDRFFIHEKSIDFITKEKISDTKVLIVGAGGLGSPAAIALSMYGPGTIGLVDSDKVELSNLNRQILHSTSRIGMSKAESSKYLLKKLNPQININIHIENLNISNIEGIIKNYDLVISAVDNIQTRYLINDYCYFMKKPMFEAGVSSFDGTCTTIIPDNGHCYRCLYPNIEMDDASCTETGVLGAVPGVIGFIQAAEAIKIASGMGNTLKNKMLLFDSLKMDFNVISFKRNPECHLCGKNPSIL